MKKMTIAELNKICRPHPHFSNRTLQAKRLVATFIKSGYEAAELTSDDFDFDHELDKRKAKYFQSVILKATREIHVDDMVKASTKGDRLFIKRVDAFAEQPEASEGDGRAALFELCTTLASLA